MADNTRTNRGAPMEPADITGISNRPFDEDVNNQRTLPERGQAEPEPDTGVDEDWPTDRSER